MYDLVTQCTKQKHSDAVVSKQVQKGQTNSYQQAISLAQECLTRMQLGCTHYEDMLYLKLK